MIDPLMGNYHALVKNVLENGAVKGDRTGTGTRSIFGSQLKFDIRHSFPLLSTKTTYFKGVVEELLWFIRGETNINPLVEKNVHIWDEWADDNGDLGPMYGRMWRAWPVGRHDHSIDQLRYCLETLKNNPDSRRMLVSSWNPEYLPHENIPPKDNVFLGLQALAPCHPLFQFYTRPMNFTECLQYCTINGIPYDKEGITSMFSSNPSDYDIPKEVIDKRLLCTSVYMRSNDLFLGAPFNIASYALLTYMVAQVCDMLPGELTYTIGDGHIYSNHVDQAWEMLSRFSEAEKKDFIVPTMLSLDPEVKDINGFSFDSFNLHNYNPMGTIKAPVAV